MKLNSKLKKTFRNVSAAVLVLAAANLSYGQTYNPFSYYTFDNTPVLKDEMNNGNLDPN